MSAEHVNSRFPQFGLATGYEALWQPDFGVLFATRCVRAAWRYAESLGVACASGFRLARVDEEPGRVLATSEEGETLEGASLVIAPGAWLTSLTERLFQLRIPTRVSAEIVCYYPPLADGAHDHSYRGMPVFCVHDDNGLGPHGYYGLPMIDVPGIKMSAHYCGPTIHPDHRPAAAGGAQWQSEADEAAAKAQLEAVVSSTTRWVSSSFPHVAHAPSHSETCLYTSTPDHDYLLDTLPGSKRIVLAGGGSGHAFKMGPAIGDCAAAIAMGQPSPLSLERFSIERLAAFEAYGGQSDAIRH